MRRTSLAERMTGSLNSGLARASSSSVGQVRRRVFSQKILIAQRAWVLVWRATFFVLFEMNEVLAKVFGRELIGSSVVILTDLAQAGVVSLLGAPTDRQQLEIVGEGFQDGVRGTFFICIGLLLLVDRSASPFAGLRSASILKWRPEENTDEPKPAKL